TLVPDSEEPSGLAGERRRVVKLATGHEILMESDGSLSFGRNYPPETQRAIRAYLHDHPVEDMATRGRQQPQQVELELAGGMPLPRDARNVLQEEPSITEQLTDLFVAGRHAPRTVTTERVSEPAWSGEIVIGGAPVPADGPSDMYK